MGRCKAQCLAWALMSNHFHLLVVTGSEPLAKLMQSLLTRYAVYFNHRYRRAGHLFQNRYKAIVCEEEPYLLELVRYIHLNPVRIGLVKSMEKLRESTLTGHSVLMGKVRLVWQGCDEVLGRFGDHQGKARKSYEEFVRDGVGKGRRPELVGGGLIRSGGGLTEFMKGWRGKDKVMGDERVLGSGEYVAEVIKAAEVRERRRHQVARELTPSEVINRTLKNPV